MSKLTKVTMLFIKASTFALSLGLVAPSLASDNSAQDQLQAQSHEQSSALSGYFKVGYGYKYEISPYEDEISKLSLFVNGRYQWHGFFLESFYGANERSEGVSVGYNFYNTENWSFDVNTVHAHGETKVYVVDNQQSFRQHRDSTNMLGLRATGNFDDITAQFMVAPYSFNDENDDGLFASAWLGKAWYIKNWEIYTSVGVKYYSEDFLEYYFELPEEIATENFSAYSPGAGVDVIGQISASYPISEHWLFETYGKFVDISSEITDNPVMEFVSGLKERNANTTEFGILVSYVF